MVIHLADSLVELLTQAELMERLRISRATLFRWRQAGLPTIKLGRTLRFDAVEVLRWVKRSAEHDTLPEAAGDE